MVKNQVDNQAASLDSGPVMIQSKSAQAGRVILSWYRMRKRDLPWRRTRDPYAILVSEMMLQQTTVKTVIPYYKKFLRRFPTSPALARARPSSVLEAWSGLGYYRRARFLHQAARVIVRDHKGKIPSDLEKIRALPGVGSYTAAAVASIAHGISEPVLDGNVIRVMSRLTALKEKLSSKSQNNLRQGARDLLAPEAPGDSNQALMELGATVCLARAPLCQNCPLRRFCKAFREGRPEHYPIRGARPRTVKEVWVATVLYKNPGTGGKISSKSRVLVQRQAKGEVNEGLYEFPRLRLPRITSSENIRKRYLKGRRWAVWGSVSHRIMNRSMHIHIASGPLRRKIRKGERLLTVEKLSKSAVSGMTRKILETWTGGQGDGATGRQVSPRGQSTTGRL